ncbi:MAG TPA: SUMF1/EgtB/PvdO family nonheme iron enzyme [Pyrinomonadaceae bacterium]|nr:SUMF1/EgtB/PvdO family nonheme iron enzyme [Pyrinomonadaceae bacterium]
MRANPPRTLVSLVIIALTHALLLTPPPKILARQGGQTRDVRVEIKVEDGKFVPLYERSYALVIGASEYGQGWPKLPGVKDDIHAVERILQRQGFQVTVETDPTAERLEKTFKDFIDRHGMDINNRLLLYFAGHGHTMKHASGEEMGYIVPVDAPRPDGDPAGFRSKALNMRQIERYAEDIQSKHALFLFDSCFSGSVLGLSRSRAIPDSITYKTANHVRQFIASGSADERVPDESIFRRQFVEGIEGEADGNRDGYVTGMELGEFLQVKVTNYSKNTQHPQYGKIRNPHLDKGDFVFALAKAPQPPPPAAADNNNPTPDTTRRADTLAAEQELEYWKAIRNSSDPEEYRGYLKKYPNGQFADIARRRAEGTRGGNDTGANTAPATPKAGTVMRAGAGVEFVYIPPGSFMMGSADSSESDEKPVHQVAIREGFYMGRYEVTQEQWRRVVGNNPSHHTGCDNCPVEQVTWEDAQEFIKKLNAMGDGFTYRLPSEAEWEYAARAGTTGEHANLDLVAWYRVNAGMKTHPVGGKQANGFGLYDMLGNVSEWCLDYWHGNYNSAPADGSARMIRGDMNSRVLRGGSWDYNPVLLRSTFRSRFSPNSKLNSVGFRVVAVARQ